MIDRDVAVMARGLVKAQQQSGEKYEQETAYRSLCEGLPILLRTAGLTRAVTFLDAKRKKEKSHLVMLQHLEQQLEGIGIFSDSKTRKLHLSEFVVSKELTMDAYCHASRMAFRVAYWHKRLAQALLRPKEGGR